jgi:plastocyanin
MFGSISKSALLCILILSGVSSALAQSSSSEVELCGIYNSTVRTFGLTPHQLDAISPASHQLEMETREAELHGSNRAELIIIPIVFHIIHFNGPENISADQIHDAVEVLNTDFRALNSDLDQVVDAFEGIAADMDVEFRLAKKDPFGNCHSGITRTVSAMTYEGEDDVKNLIGWPRDMYLNVWVCESAGGAAGYAYLPGSVNSFQDAWLDGIVIQDSYTGSIGTSNSYRKRTLTHEVGHWLNLRHLWGWSNTPGEEDNCDMDDGVSDTPNTKGWTSCNVTGESCGSLDNVQNYLEYSYCGRMFTEGQKTRLRTAALSSVSDRNNLSTNSNLIATGVQGDPVLCEALFSTNQVVICVGDSIQFDDMSYHDVSSWSWDFGDGSSLSGSEQGVHDSPYHTFDEQGIFDVVLTAGNSQGEIESAPVSISVLPAGAMYSPATQGFENNEFPSADWFREDPFEDGGWEINDEVAYSGSRSLHIENWQNTIEFNRDFLMSSTMDLSQDIVEVRVSYKWAYCYKGFDDDDETDDRLRISVTGDCGADWDLRKMHRGYTDLVSAEPHYYPFIPENNTEWNSYTLTLTQSIYLTPHFRVMFEFESRLGNDIYLDDINITAYTQEMIAVEELSFGPSWNLHPNPSEGVSQLNCTTVNEHEARITLVDASGRLVETIYTGQLPAGPHNFEISPADKRRGTYFVVIELDGKPKALPWIIK